MKKEKILFVNDAMRIGGNTTSLLSLLHCIDLEKYDVDLLLYRNMGEMLPLIPEGIRLLPQAFAYEGLLGRIKKYLKVFFSGYARRARRANKRLGREGYARAVMADCQAYLLSRRLPDEYDYAVGFIEGWADHYAAHIPNVKHRYAWLHSKFEEICPDPDLERPWMEKVDHIVNVSEQGHLAFCEAMPDMKGKAIYIKNILSSRLVRARATMTDENDEAYLAYKKANVFKIVTVGRIDLTSKALERAVACAAKLKKEGYRFLWYIVGDGPDYSYLKAKIEEAGVNDVLVMIGKRVNPMPFVAAADIFCLTSRFEGKPMVVTEAMILSVPPVVTEYASAHEQIKDGIEGRIAPNNDEAIHDEIKFCLDHPDEVACMSTYLAEHEYGNEEYIKYIEETLFNSSPDVSS